MEKLIIYLPSHKDIMQNKNNFNARRTHIQSFFLNRESHYVYAYICIFSLVRIYPTPPLQTGCDTMSIFKSCKAGLNTEFSFSFAKPRLQNPVCLTIDSYLRGEWIHAFLKDIKPKRIINSLTKDLNHGHKFHFLQLVLC